MGYKKFVRVVEEFSLMIARNEFECKKVKDLHAAAEMVMKNPDDVVKVKDFLGSLNPFMRSIILSHLCVVPGFMEIYNSL